MRKPSIVADPDGVLVSLKTSVGVAVGERRSADELIGDADLPLYRAKTAGRN